MPQLSTNTTLIDECISIANTLPDAGGGGSAEMCTVTCVNNTDGDIDFAHTTATGYDNPYMGGNSTLSFETKKGSLFALYGESVKDALANDVIVEGNAVLLLSSENQDGVTLFVFYTDGNCTITFND